MMDKGNSQHCSHAAQSRRILLHVFWVVPGIGNLNRAPFERHAPDKCAATGFNVGALLVLAIGRSPTSMVLAA